MAARLLFSLPREGRGAMECGVCRQVVHGDTIQVQPCCQLNVCTQCAAAARGCTSNDASAELLSLTSEAGMMPGSMRTLLGDVYKAKLGIFGGPAGGAPA